MINNLYPELPTVPYKRTSIDMESVNAYIKESPYIPEVQRACYTFFRIESGNGKSGINNNYIGLQVDNAKWGSHVSEKIIGTTLKEENGTGKQRRFACFASFKDSLDILEYKILDRGLFIGGIAHPYHTGKVNTIHDLVIAYYRNWVRGSNTDLPDAEFTRTFLSIYRQAETKF